MAAELDPILNDFEDYAPPSLRLVSSEVKPKPRKWIRKGLAVLALTATLCEGAMIYTAVDENNSARKNADVSTSAYLLNYENYWQRTGIGFTFAPEDLGLTAANYKTPTGEKITQKALSELDILHKDMLMSAGRIAFQEQNLVDANGKFNFDFYKPYFEKMVNNKMDITIDFGPRTSGWPEFKIPNNKLNDVKSAPTNGTIINSNAEIGKQSVMLANELFAYLTSHYSKEQLSAIKMVQVGNENDNDWGNPSVRLSQEFQLKLISIVHKEFPDKKILLNSAGQMNLDSTADTIKKAIIEDPSLENKMVQGVDYYLDIGSVNMPLVGEADPLDIPFVGKIDPIAWDKIAPISLNGIAPIGGDKFENSINDAINNKYGKEVTEFGVEPWKKGDYSKGSRILNLKYGLIRLVENVLPKKGQVLIRLWGLQDWFNTLDKGGALADETKEMEKVVKGINAISSDTSGETFQIK